MQLAAGWQLVGSWERVRSRALVGPASGSETVGAVRSGSLASSGGGSGRSGCVGARPLPTNAGLGTWLYSMGRIKDS